MNDIYIDNIDLTKEPPVEEPQRQYYFMAKARKLVKELEQKLGRKPSFHVSTFGCPTV